MVKFHTIAQRRQTFAGVFHSCFASLKVDSRVSIEVLQQLAFCDDAEFQQ